MSSVSKSILLVDDDQEIRELLDTYLSRAGFQVRTVGDGADFRQAFNEAPSDLLILDVMLPDEDGFSLCRWVRQHPRQPHVPIIMLTASSDEADRVIGLELGADDYLGKPFSPRELQARIKALLRRAQFGHERTGNDVMVFDEWRLDMVSHRLFHSDGEEVILSGADFALLKLFLDNPQQILDRDTIGNATRGRELMPLERIVDMAVSRLRQRLRDTGKAPRLIRTVRGSGYLLATNVSVHASNGY
ncbi:response regulator [Pseudomonas capsici]|uniref:Response regulator transcription factor n=1 Tax=Pseudomonas capsici TaxID=2810614 RepID=A0ABT3C359_9PSED|nr:MULTISPECIES: response regulator transcription factor [Pseudomonas]MBN6713985.1 response regulator transcription factor [Pseudomonas capsici]MBN6719459.1 response regulator transcription factor [Pseudomonas capsici]MBN6722727.1 response regulator transcription factor [Pseudomonas capsici]MBX8474717.1 response regulator transcription factor [Pseudomonas cichorii]MBX8610311.1 response regulator transcription factor [Pseudomonas cichorii]